VVSVRVKLLGAKLGAEFIGMAAAHPGECIVEYEHIGRVGVVELAAEAGLVDRQAIYISMLVTVDALKLDDGKIPGAKIAQSQRLGPIPLL